MRFYGEEWLICAYKGKRGMVDVDICAFFDL